MYVTPPNGKNRPPHGLLFRIIKRIGMVNAGK